MARNREKDAGVTRGPRASARWCGRCCRRPRRSVRSIPMWRSNGGSKRRTRTPALPFPPPVEVGLIRLRPILTCRTREHPSSVWGRVREGGQSLRRQTCAVESPPPPTPPHKGEGSRAQAPSRPAPPPHADARRTSAARSASSPAWRRSTSCCARAAPEFARGGQGVDAAPPAAAGEIRRRRAARDQVRLRAEGRPAAGDRGSGRGRAAATTARRCCSASPAPARPSPWRR